MLSESKPDPKIFIEYIDLYSCPLVSYAHFFLNSKSKNDVFNTFFLGKSHSVASRFEEILDFYNAKNNSQWSPLRENIAAIKMFTNAAYVTLHLKSTSPNYKLNTGLDLFLKETDNVLDSFHKALGKCFKEFMKLAGAIGLSVDFRCRQQYHFDVDHPEGRLESDLEKRSIDTPEKVIINLSTSYLNLASESDLLIDDKIRLSKTYEEFIPDMVSENILRILENKFHNLQSLYDTYISNSNIESMDSDLRLIRGHASIVYHLLEASTSLSHFYERHMMRLASKIDILYTTPVSVKVILGLLFDYFLNYAGQFLTAGVNLCRGVLQKYAEEGDIEVGVPKYRGFHVRPSTLVSKIVQHYGGKVFLLLGDEKYDAAMPMDLFRVNEKINAEKRRSLAEKICSLHSVNDPACMRNFKKGLKEVFHELLEENKIINYSTEFSLPELKEIDEETLGEFANRAIAFLLAQGKIDLRTDLKVKFQGDKRVLADLKILADSGYGEDSYGNNVVLPEELSYLRR